MSLSTRCAQARHVRFTYAVWLTRRHGRHIFDLAPSRHINQTRESIAQPSRQTAPPLHKSAFPAWERAGALLWETVCSVQALGALLWRLCPPPPPATQHADMRIMARFAHMNMAHTVTTQSHKQLGCTIK